MPYQSVDSLQRALADSIFANRQDVKKAAGRALGTIVELVTFYIVREWGFLPNLSIERGLAEFANDSITHNVEFGLHPVLSQSLFTVNCKLPLSAKKIAKQIDSTPSLHKYRLQDGDDKKSHQLLSSEGVIRNACTLADTGTDFLVANLQTIRNGISTISVSRLRSQPFAMVECKRVGVEEGMRKGPTTIEKAKQGAYVAKHVSALQKIRGRDGTMFGAMPKDDGSFDIRELSEELRRLVFDAQPEELDGFILTVGVVSNHGNWFTHDDPNKELLVLKQSYDWLLFLTDPAIGEFVEDTLLSDSLEMAPVRVAFRDSYASGESGKNQFTKVKISKAAHDVLTNYFGQHIARIEENWFNVLSPSGADVHQLKAQLRALAAKMQPQI
jgi:hypothetical protein